MTPLLLGLLLLAPLAHAQELLLAQTTPPRLEWSYQAASGCAVPTPTVDIQSSSTFGGTYTRVVQLPITATTYTLPSSANNLFYRVSNPCGNSNIVQYTAASVPPTGPTLDQRVTTVETSLAALRLADQSLSSANVAQDTAISSIQAALAAAQSAMQALINRVTMLEAVPPPAPTSTFTITHIDATHIRIVCNGVGITTSGSGTSRTMECRQ